MRISKKTIRETAKALPDTQVFFDRSAIVERVRIYEGYPGSQGTQVIYFRRNRQAWDYLCGKLEEHIKTL
jgi:hypothetical protein